MIARNRNEGIHFRIDRFDPIQESSHHFYRRELSRLEEWRQLGNRVEQDFRSCHGSGPDYLSRIP
jgi:hypothetical protein